VVCYLFQIKKENLEKMYKNKRSSFFIILFAVMIIPLFLTAGNSTNVIIPKPQKLLPGNGKFLLTKQTRYFSDTSLSQNATEYLQRQLKQNAGYLLKKGIASKDTILKRSESLRGTSSLLKRSRSLSKPEIKQVSSMRSFH